MDTINRIKVQKLFIFSGMISWSKLFNWETNIVFIKIKALII